MSHQCTTHLAPCGCTTRRRLLRQTIAGGFVGATGIGLLSGCSENALGRRSLQLFSDEQLEAAALQSWNQLKATSTLSTNRSFNARVQRIGGDMVRVSRVGGSPEFIVIEDESPNAFVLPGAKVAVHTGMFQVATADDELAAVLGHEMGHVVAKHANERASQQGLANLAIGVLTDGGEKEGLAKALGIGATLGVLLPYGREHELESDRLGVRYAHAGGYDPAGAIRLWDKMARLGGSRPPELLSTHPGPSDRQAVIRAEIAKL